MATPPTAPYDPQARGAGPRIDGGIAPPTVPRRDPAPRRWTADEFARARQLGLFAGRSVELDDGAILERAPDGTARPFVFTRTEVYRLDEYHFFDNQRVQLIGGELLLESPMNTPHATAVSLGMEALRVAFGTGRSVRVQLPIDLGATSEPQPDLAVVTGSPRDYLAEHPKTALLVVEVSDSTIEADTHDKASLYASDGITDYWVIDLTTDRVLVSRDPRPDARAKFGHTYAEVSAYGRDERFAPLAAPHMMVAAGDLLP